MNSKISSPYAAPNTPIASSKRPRINSAKKEQKAVEVKSPVKVMRSNHNVQNCSTPELGKVHKIKLEEESNTNLSTNTGAKLFSPVLKKTNESEDNEQKDSEIPATYNESTATEIVEENEEEIFNPYLFIASLPSHSSVMDVGKICLPSQSTNVTSIQTLVLDLDETLVHCTVEPIDKPDMVFPVMFNDIYYQVYVRKRPYLDYFLQSISRSFEVVVFTASQKIYANNLLNLLDPDNKIIKHRLFREACLLVQGNYLKDLSVLNRDLTKTMIVDNSPHAYGYQIDNGIPIESWFDDESDTELLKLLGFLRRIHTASDVRALIHDHFKTYDLVSNAKKGQTGPVITPPF